MPRAYASWVGQAAILHVASEDLRVPLRGIIMGESESAVRLRIGEGYDIDIFKPMIEFIEQDNWANIIKRGELRPKLGVCPTEQFQKAS